IQDEKITTQLRDRPIDCAYRDPNGVVWFVTPSSVFRVADERLNTLSKPGALSYKFKDAEPAGHGLVLRQLDLPTTNPIVVSPESRAKAITRDQLGRLWISSRSGTFRLDPSGWTSLASLGGPEGTAISEFTDSKGRVWFGLANRVAMLEESRVKVFSGEDGV